MKRLKDESDFDLLTGPVPVRSKMWRATHYAGLDRGIRFAVRVLHAYGIETCQSCQGGEGHSYDHPTVDLSSGSERDTDGLKAVACLAEYDLPVRTLAMLWSLDKRGLPYERIWRITFRHTMEARADEAPMFVWGYQTRR